MHEHNKDEILEKRRERTCSHHQLQQRLTSNKIRTTQKCRPPPSGKKKTMELLFGFCYPFPRPVSRPTIADHYLSNVLRIHHINHPTQPLEKRDSYPNIPSQEPNMRPQIQPTDATTEATQTPHSTKYTDGKAVAHSTSPCFSSRYRGTHR